MSRTSGWGAALLGDLVDVLDSQRVPVSAKERSKRPGTVPYFGAAGQVGWIDEPIFDEPLVLLGEDGVQFFDWSRPKAYLVDGPAWVNNHAHVLRAGEAIDRRFLAHYLNFADYRGFANGTTRLKLTQAAMRRIPVPLPELGEQRRIVESLEDHLSRVDAAEAYVRSAMSRARALEQTVLARCREGEWVKLSDVTNIQGGIQKQQKRVPRTNAFPFLRVANVAAGGLDLSDVHEIELFEGELDRLRLEQGDLLVVEGNGSASQIGRAAVWDGSIKDCVHQNHLIRVRPTEGLLPEYLEAFWNSPQNRTALTEVASSSSGLHTLSVGKLSRLEIPVPSLARQRELALEVQRVREATTRVDGESATAIQRSVLLRRSLLTAAFSGRLTAAGGDASAVEETIKTSNPIAES